jgi:hypothetical protein
VVGDTAKLYECDYTIIIIINKVVGDTAKLYECDYTVMSYYKKLMLSCTKLLSQVGNAII